MASDTAMNRTRSKKPSGTTTDTISSVHEPAGDKAADAVRRYLTFLTNPESLVDGSLVELLKARGATETDVLARLKIEAAIATLETVDETSLRKDFVRHARNYAQREDIPAEAFAAMGVGADILAEAGLSAKRHGGGKSGGGKSNGATARASAPKPGGTRSRVGRDQIVELIPTGFFTIRELEERSGANTLTVRRVVEDLITAGRLAEYDPDSEYQGRGRAPRRYKTI